MNKNDGNDNKGLDRLFVNIVLLVVCLSAELQIKALSIMLTASIIYDYELTNSVVDFG